MSLLMDISLADSRALLRSSPLSTSALSRQQEEGTLVEPMTEWLNFGFKNISTLHVTICCELNYRFPPDPPKGKGNRISETKGILVSGLVPVLRVVKAYHDRFVQPSIRQGIQHQPVAKHQSVTAVELKVPPENMKCLGHDPVVKSWGMTWL